MQAPESFRQLIENEMEARRLRNPRYTLRAFAKHVGLMPGQLSELISGKKGLSRNRALILAEKMGFSPDEQNDFVDRVELECARAESIRKLAHARIQERLKYKTTETSLTADIFQAVSDWHHFAILALTGTPQFKSEPLWIAEELGIPRASVESAIERMLRLELLTKSKGKLSATQDHVLSPDGIPSEAVRKHHEGILTKAIEALYTCPIDERDFFESTYAIDPENLPEIKKKVRTFLSQIMEEYGSSPKRTRVYSFGSHAFPLSRANKTPKKEEEQNE